MLKGMCGVWDIGPKGPDNGRYGGIKLFGEEFFGAGAGGNNRSARVDLSVDFGTVEMGSAGAGVG